MRIGIDVGGTFTDFVLFDVESGVIERYKVLSTPRKPAEAVLAGLQELSIDNKFELVHGSTVGTNALLERKGTRTALITTEGFGDLLAIGRQNRPALYDLASRRSDPLVPQNLRFEVDERVDHKGQVLRSLDESIFPELLRVLKEQKIESIAIAFLFSFLYPEHEAKLAKILRQSDFFVSTSSEEHPEFREFERTSTTVINAYIAPIMDTYLRVLEQNLNTKHFNIMQSNGGIVQAVEIRKQAVAAILSGPAGGVVGARYVARSAGFKRAISFDMGGTSTDVSLIDGELRQAAEAEVGGYPIRIPMIDIHTIGSGGGSMAWVDGGGALRVGPQSAGADPGPVSYGFGGKIPTVTDANLVLGRLAGDSFLNGAMVLNKAQAEKALDSLGKALDIAPQNGLTLAQTASLGVIDVVNTHMERALRVISVGQGFDVQDFVLVSFGGAGGLHALGLAQALGIRKVLIPYGASTLSAFGMLASDVAKDYVQTVMETGDVQLEELERRFEQMAERGRDDLARQGVSEDRIRLKLELDMRYAGQGYELKVHFSPGFIAAFHARHEQQYGYHSPDAPIEIVNLRLQAIGAVLNPKLRKAPKILGNGKLPILDHRSVVLTDNLIQSIPIYNGKDLRAGHSFQGPVVILYEDTTVFLSDGDHAVIDEHKNLIVVVEQ